MPKLKLAAVEDDKPVRISLELPAALHRDLVAYGEVLGRQGAGKAIAPDKLIAPMLARFMSTDRAFVRLRKAAAGSAGADAAPLAEKSV
jgi:hypothetical protein